MRLDSCGSSISLRYASKSLPFTLTELYTPTGLNSTGPMVRGLYTKRAQVPGGKMLQLPTVVVDHLEYPMHPEQTYYILFSCKDLHPLPPVRELVIATRALTVDSSVVDGALQVASDLGVPFRRSEVKLADHQGCP